MKLSTVLLFIGMLQIMASTGFSQYTELSLKLNNTEVREVLGEIEKIGEVYFLYSSKLVDVKRRVSIDVRNENIENVLAGLFHGENIDFTFMNNQIILAPGTSAPQPRMIRGIVTDEAGDPLVGVSIIIKGTNTGTITNINGEYELEIPDDAEILVFQFIGMITQEVPIEDKRSIYVTMEADVLGLEEVIVIGYGTVKKSDLTGSVSTLKADEIGKQQVTRIDQALQGRTAGLQVTSINGAPGSATTMRIRGGNSISAGNEPLFIIDGIIGGGDLNLINPYDVESVEILKDASSTAIYGSRGANGVVIVTTKRGRTNSPPQINFNIYYGIQQHVKKFDVLNGYEFADFANDFADYTGIPLPFPTMDGVVDSDWQELAFRNAPVLNTDVSVSGGSTTNNYFLSFNHYNQEGIVINSGYKRNQFRLNFDQEIGKIFKIGTSLSFSKSDRNNGTVSIPGLSRNPTSAPIYNEDGTYFSVNQVHGSLYNNCLAESEYRISDDLRNRALGNFYVKINISDKLYFQSTFGFDINTVKQNRYDYGDLPTRKAFETGGYGAVTSSFPTTIQSENILNYNTTISGDHDIGLMGGFTYQTYNYESVSANTSGFANDITFYHSLESGDPLLNKVSSDNSEWTIVSEIVRLNYSYRSKYLFTATGRYDGSSRLGADNKYAFFPSVAFAWRISEESFLDNLDIFNTLKYRISYGKTGNQAVGVYATLPKLSTGNTIIGGENVVTYIQGGLENASLKWETTDQFNTGFDMSFFKGKLYLEADYYYKITHDLLLNRAIPLQTGYASKLENIGDVQNQGFEFLARYNLVSNGGFSWEPSINISLNRNKVMDIGGEDYIITWQSGGSRVANGKILVGEPLGTFVGQEFIGIWKENEIPEGSGIRPGDPKFRDVNGDGVSNEVDDELILGNAEPVFYGGFNNTFNYKNFTLSLFFQGSYGNEIYNRAANYLFFGNGTNVVGRYRDRWTPDNPTSDFPRAGSVLGERSYSLYVEDGSYLKLKNLYFQYDIPVTIFRNNIKKLALYFTGTNLLTFTKYTGYEPDVNADGTSSTLRGYDTNVYPQARSYVFGIKATF